MPKMEHLEGRSVSNNNDFPEISLNHKEINNYSMDVETQMLDTHKNSEVEEEKQR
jgi:hypothetical protein